MKSKYHRFAKKVDEKCGKGMVVHHPPLWNVAKRKGETVSSTHKHYKYEYLTSRWGGMKLRKEMGPRIEHGFLDFLKKNRN